MYNQLYLVLLSMVLVRMAIISIWIDETRSRRDREGSGALISRRTTDEAELLALSLH
jgi:hypothetical protein